MLMLTKEYLDKNYVSSSYNEGTDEELVYYINGRKCNVGDTAYLYSEEENQVMELIIVKIILRSDDPQEYEELISDDNILIDGEDKYIADTSAEFITDNDCCLVWFKEV